VIKSVNVNFNSLLRLASDDNSGSFWSASPKWELSQNRKYEHAIFTTINTNAKKEKNDREETSTKRGLSTVNYSTS
jgi:hypothetical protein